MQAEHDVVLGLIAGIQHGLGHGQHQAHGAVVILEAVVVHVVVRAHHDLVVGALALDGAGDVVGGSGVDLHLIVHGQRGGDGALRQFGLNGLGILQTDGYAGNAGGRADILGVERLVGHLGKAADIGRDDGGCTLILSLQHRIGDPPVGALVDIDQHDLAGGVHALVIPHGALVQIQHLGGEALLRRGGGGIGIHGVGLAVHHQRGAVVAPQVARGRLLLHVGKADLLHHGGDVVGGVVLRLAAGIATAHVLGAPVQRVFRQLQRHVIGELRGNGLDEGVVGGLGGGCLHRLRGLGQRAAQGAQRQHRGQKQG